MSAGKFVGEAAVAAILRWNPFGPEAYARRDRNKAYRKVRRKASRGETLTEDEYEILQTQEVRSIMAEQVVMQLPDGSKVVRTEPVIKARTSTKNAATLVIAPLASLAVVLPFYGEIDAFVQQVCGSEEGPTRALIIIGATWLVTAVPSYITTRLTKSPAVPGAL